MKIKINGKLVNYIEALQYEKDRTNEIVAFMLSHNYDTTTLAFQQWNEDNQKIYIKYREAKNEMENQYINNNPEFKGKKIEWNLDFSTKMLIAGVVDAKEN